MPFSLGKDWSLILYHNSKNGFFTSKFTSSFSLKNDRFSVISRIDDRFQTSEGYFEFILYYPDIEEWCQWKQLQNPLNVTDITKISFIPVTCEWQNIQYHQFKGLRKSLSSLAFLDSANYGDFFYAVGMYKEDSYYEGLPGPFWNYKDKTLWEEYLYMKVEDHSLLKYLYSVCSCHCYNSFTLSRIALFFVIMI